MNLRDPDNGKLVSAQGLVEAARNVGIVLTVPLGLASLALIQVSRVVAESPAAVESQKAMWEVSVAVGRVLVAVGVMSIVEQGRQIVEQLAGK